MSITTTLYLADVFNDINNVCGITLLLGSIFFTILFIIRLAEYDDDDILKIIKPVLGKWTLLVWVAIVGCLTPTKNTMYMMMAKSYMKTSSIPPKVAEALELKLDKYISELKGGKND